MTENNTLTTDEKMRREFNEWAEAGKGEEMEGHHISITQQTLALMGLKPGQRVLDLGCGAGWASRLLAQMVGGGERPGQVIGVDVSDEMIRRARANSKQFDNVMFVVGSAQQIPWEEDFFDKVLSVESFYYYGDQAGALNEVFRVMAPEWRVVHPYQFVRGQPLFVALGGRIESSSSGALGAGIHRSSEGARIRRRAGDAYS